MCTATFETFLFDQIFKKYGVNEKHPIKILNHHIRKNKPSKKDDIPLLLPKLIINNYEIKGEPNI